MDLEQSPHTALQFHCTIPSLTDWLTISEMFPTIVQYLFSLIHCCMMILVKVCIQKRPMVRANIHPSSNGFEAKIRIPACVCRIGDFQQSVELPNSPQPAQSPIAAHGTLPRPVSDHCNTESHFSFHIGEGP